MTAMAQKKSCGCNTHDICYSIPPEFVRMRYYFGQLLGAVDFSDEQAYHIGKLRFHNRRTHGTGVLCGLRAQRFVWPQNAPPETSTSVLRVIRGAAIDACGREILVGVDQCIDVNAWYHANRDRPEVQEWFDAEEPHRLYVALRYRDCPSDPAPAPRDPCGCDAGGCEFGRVRESFELALLLESEMDRCAYHPFPALDELWNHLTQLNQPATMSDVESILHELIAQDCPEPISDPWLCLSCFEVVFDDGPVVSDIQEVDNTISERNSLLSTETLQSILLQILSGQSNEGLLAQGPQIDQVIFEGVDSDTTSGSLLLQLNLLPDRDNSETTIPLELSTFQNGYVQVHRFEIGSGWSSVATNVSYNDTETPPRFLLEWDGVLSPGQYRVTVESPHETPIVDEQMNPLLPTSFSYQFQLIEEDGKLVQAQSLF